MLYTPNQLLAAMSSHGYRVFRGEWNINLIGIRAADQAANSFNDYIAVLFEHLLRWNLFVFPATTDPGVFYRQNPISDKGTAIVMPGQYPRCWELGKHRGQYEALVQRGPISVSRDNNRDAVLDLDADQLVDAGLNGINLHRASLSGQSFEVGKWSAGCQVVRAPWDYDVLMALCRRAAVDWGDTFTYTLLDEASLSHQAGQ